jgi:hypothetical protein
VRERMFIFWSWNVCHIFWIKIEIKKRRCQEMIRLSLTVKKDSIYEFQELLFGAKNNKINTLWIYFCANKSICWTRKKVHVELCSRPFQSSEFVEFKAIFILLYFFFFVYIKCHNRFQWGLELSSKRKCIPLSRSNESNFKRRLPAQNDVKKKSNKW